MRAVGYYTPSPIEAADSLLDLELPVPGVNGHDLLVEVRAIAVNPVDTKVRARTAPPDGEPKLLGWDACGIVVDTGPDVTLFKPGDAVWYRGSA